MAWVQRKAAPRAERPGNFEFVQVGWYWNDTAGVYVESPLEAQVFPTLERAEITRLPHEEIVRFVDALLDYANK